MPVPDHIRVRREAEAARRRAARRRGLVALAAVALGVVVVALLVAGGLGGGGDDGGSSGAQKASTGAPAPKPSSTTTKPAPATGTYRGPVPILMYHVVTAPPAGTAYPELWTPRETFKATVALLKDRGYHGVTLDRVWKAWHGGPGLPPKPVVLTFDDGYLSQSTHAKPILRAAGWPGVLYLEGKSLGPGGLTSKQVKAMLAAGWQVGSHTMTHPDLTTVGDDRLETELTDSKKLLETTFDITVTAFCYPAGRNDARVRAAVQAAGYENATTVDPGIAKKSDDPFELPRIRVNGTDTPEQVLERVRTGEGASGAGYG